MSENNEMCPISEAWANCQGERCAWWDRHTFCCSIRTITLVLRDMRSHVSDITLHASDIAEHFDEKERIAKIIKG